MERIWKDLGEEENVIKIFLNSKIVLSNKNVIVIVIIIITMMVIIMKEHLLFLQGTQDWFWLPPHGSSYNGSITPFWLPRAPSHMWHM